MLCIKNVIFETTRSNLYLQIMKQCKYPYSNQLYIEYFSQRKLNKDKEVQAKARACNSSICSALSAWEG